MRYGAISFLRYLLPLLVYTVALARVPASLEHCHVLEGFSILTLSFRASESKALVHSWGKVWLCQSFGSFPPGLKRDSLPILVGKRRLDAAGTAGGAGGERGLRVVFAHSVLVPHFIAYIQIRKLKRF